MKISIIGAGNVGSLAAMRLAEESAGEILLIDIVKGFAHGKALDMEDAKSILRCNYNIDGSDDINRIKGSAIVIITAGLARTPGMTREDLLIRNGTIVNEVSQQIRKLSPKAIVVVVTNPVDLMTRAALEATSFPAHKVIGMGPTLDASRFANLISKELNAPVTEIEALVVGVHGEGMQPLPRFTNIKGVSLEELLEEAKIKNIIKKTVERGVEIVSLLGKGSAFFAPSAAIASLVKAIIKDEKRILGVSAYLKGEYGIKDVCIGVPCRLGKNGIEEILELDLNGEEAQMLSKSANRLKEQYKLIKI